MDYIVAAAEANSAGEMIRESITKDVIVVAGA
jgi:hypothetical protein